LKIFEGHGNKMEGIYLHFFVYLQMVHQAVNSYSYLAPFLDADWLLLPFLGNKASSVAILSNPQLKAQNRGFISALEGC